MRTEIAGRLRTALDDNLPASHDTMEVSPVRVSEAKREFQSHLKKLGLDARTLSPSSGVEAMLTWYRNARADHCDPAQDGDMLLYQFGTYDWGEGEHFEFGITRQFVVAPGEDEDLWQLSLTFGFQADKLLRELGSGNRWCASSVDLDAFAQYVREQPSYRAVAGRTDASVQLRHGRAG